MQIFYRFIVIILCLLPSSLVMAQRSLLQDESNTISVFKKMSPYVVFVYRIQRVVSSYDSYYIPSGAGSGFIWNDQGYVVTNYHVVRGAQRVAISFQKGKTLFAKIVGIEPRKDIAVLRIVSKEPLPKFIQDHPVPLANSASLIVGQKTIAIGNPYGLDRTLTTGIISALGRRVRGSFGTIYDMIQTDASINPGNSGGPLLDSQGQLIGMNTMIVSKSGSSAGIGFAVPANTIKRIVDQLIKYGRVIEHGIGIHQVDERIAAQLGVRGLIIGDIIPGSPAEKAGLKGTYRNSQGQIIFGDIIIGVDGKRVSNYEEFYNQLEQKRVGQTVKVIYVRNKRKFATNVRIIDRELLRN